MPYTIERNKAGIFQSAYNFEDESNGTASISGWTQGGGTNVTIVPDIGQHRKVMKFSRDNAAGISSEIVRAFSSSQSQGVVEFWNARTNVFKNQCKIDVSLEQSATTVCCGVKIDNGTIKNWANTTIVTISAPVNTPLHFAVLFNNNSADNQDVGDGDATLDAYQYRIYVNGTKYGDYSMTNAQNANQLRIKAEDPTV